MWRLDDIANFGTYSLLLAHEASKKHAQVWSEASGLIYVGISTLLWDYIYQQ